MVRQVEQDEAVELLVVLATVEPGVPQHPVSLGDVEPFEQAVRGVGAPDARSGPRRRGASYADRGEVEPAHGVERRGLARSGRPGERDHGVVGRKAQPGFGPINDGCSGCDHRVFESSLACLHGLPERCYAAVE